MNGAEKCLSQECQDCELGGRFWMFLDVYGGSQMKQRYMEVLREIQAICEEKVKGGCEKSCPFYYDDGCLFVLYPKYWEWDKFEVERGNMNPLETIIDYYGRDKQKTKVIEELSELIKAICKNDVENIKEEIADVSIMLSQLQIIYGFSDWDIEIIKEKKINRTIERMGIEI